MSGGTVAANKSNHGVPFPNTAAMGTFAPVTSPFSNANTDTHTHGFFSLQPVSTRQFVVVLLNSLSCYDAGLFQCRHAL